MGKVGKNIENHDRAPLLYILLHLLFIGGDDVEGVNSDRGSSWSKSRTSRWQMYSRIKVLKQCPCGEGGNCANSTSCKNTIDKLLYINEKGKATLATKRQAVVPSSSLPEKYSASSKNTNHYIYSEGQNCLNVF